VRRALPGNNSPELAPVCVACAEAIDAGTVPSEPGGSTSAAQERYGMNMTAMVIVGALIFLALAGTVFWLWFRSIEWHT
jgi:hypothetical protein